MFKDNNAIYTEPTVCCDAVREPGLGDKLHKIYAVAQENVNDARRIHEFMFASANNSEPTRQNCDPRCMNEELNAIMDELQRLRLILLDINEKL